MKLKSCHLASTGPSVSRAIRGYPQRLKVTDFFACSGLDVRFGRSGRMRTAFAQSAGTTVVRNPRRFVYFVYFAVPPALSDGNQFCTKLHLVRRFQFTKPLQIKHLRSEIAPSVPEIRGQQLSTFNILQVLSLFSVERHGSQKKLRRSATFIESSST